MEEIVKYATALLAKEKGFDWQCQHYYQNSKRAGVFKINPHITNSVVDELLEADEFSVIACTVPSQSVLARWLREVYNIHVWLIPATLTTYRAYVGQGMKLDLLECLHTESFETYEEAFEAGLVVGLNLVP